MDLKYHNGDFEDFLVTNPDGVFVFGSNLLGLHGGGAAGYARTKFFAPSNRSQGNINDYCYALPTCDLPGRALSNAAVIGAIELFIATAKVTPKNDYFVTPVGCGIAGFAVEWIAWNFWVYGGPHTENLWFPREFEPFFEKWSVSHPNWT